MKEILNNHTFSVLEFSKIVKLLKERAISAIGEQMAEKLIPSNDLKPVLKAQRETTEMREIIRYEGIPPLAKLEDVRVDLKKSEIKGTILDALKILKILKILITSRQVKKFLLKIGEKYPLIKEKADRIKIFNELEEEILYCVGEDGVVLDRASLELKKIRKEIIKKEQNIKNKLESIIKSSHFSTIIQEPLVTIRQDRFVIPIKQERKGKFPGIIHDKSDSGATVFIEPFEIVELNNTLRQLMKDEEREVLKILQRLTTHIGENAQEIYYSAINLGEIDFIYAKATLANKMDAIEPIVNQKGFINLIQTRHPLLKDDVVPININLGKDFNILVITGPNTGGKTVTLKTVGLITLMAQCGLHIPAAYGSEVAVFQKIYCDIGDEQSIEQNLSTFSSHMKHIVKILQEADPNTLVLLDELGAGTDPTEGAALGMAILDYLHKEKVKVISTTHHDTLKNYAYLTKGICNARVEFNEKTLNPTFQISIGLPGKSCAFIIAQKLGLSSEVVSRAQSYLSQEKIKTDSLIERIEQDKKLVEHEKNLTTLNKEESLKIKNQLEKELNDIKGSKKDIILKAYQEAEKIIRETQDKAEKIMINLNKKRALNKKSKSILFEELHEMKEDVKEKLIPEKKLIENQNINVGDYVLIRSLNKEGTVLSISDKGEKCKIQIDNIKISASIFDLEKVEKIETKNNKYIYTADNTSKKLTEKDNFYLSKIKDFKNEISLRQFSVDEAKPILEKYLDDAYLLGISPVYIIHGKGKGILRIEVRKLLENIPYVKSFRFGNTNEGGTGVTLVYLKK